MISKSLLRKRLSVAIDKPISPADFSWFFSRFCEVCHLPARVKTAKELDAEQVNMFSHYCGYDLRFPIPLPLTAQI